MVNGSLIHHHKKAEKRFVMSMTKMPLYHKPIPRKKIDGIEVRFIVILTVLSFFYILMIDA
jgi:hypothetical protein